MGRRLALLLAVAASTAALFAQNTEAVVELWRTLDARYVGVATTYTYRIRAFNIGGFSSYSNAAWATTQ